jgi:hypothetical protein
MESHAKRGNVSNLLQRNKEGLSTTFDVESPYIQK